MSAISGIFNLNNEPVPFECSSALMGHLNKYPTNDTGTFLVENIFLGCHAQWITPESIGEKLPYYDHQRKLAITADAIIDNREELFERLQIRKNLKEDTTDSELILRAYEKWGEESPKFLLGDFAYMIWDEKNRKFFGARDFSGSRPLYYYGNQHTFAFCTTMEALMQLPFVSKELNEDWIAQFLAISAVVDAVDSSITPFQKIKQVPPSHCITINNKKITLKKYCELQPEKPLILKSSEEYVEAFQDVFREAVKSRLRTFRQIGAHLSGGLDSSSVVSYAAMELGGKKPLHTFSYIPTSDFVDYTPKRLLADERPFINKTVNFIGGLKDSYFDFKERNSYTDIDDYLDILEMPYKFFENSFWVKGMFEKSQKMNVGVLLNGGRGNFTISWGHAMNYYAELMKKMKLLKLINELNQYSKKAGGARFRRVPFVAKLAFPFLNKAFPQLQTYIFPKLINEDFASNTNVFKLLQEHGLNHTGWSSSTDIYEQRRKHFQDLFHWNATNTFAAKLSLKYSVWKRDATNDLRIVKFCLSVPEDQYVSNGMDRALIRRATKNYLPDEVRLNQRVRGVQGADWLHRMRPHWEQVIIEMEELSVNESTMRYLDPQTIKAALQKAKQGFHSEDATDPLIRVLMRSLIFHRFLQRVS
ncbi:asparagine synthase-related protein [Sutcliffiella rhizosphaerae]|uniref:asparagine synthase (glutamine-hydrolyzing) n=1 Tax=Sutcliffiella rhizosphaerae TaxID=2880967 RepID=A0ABM8YLE6_9BACI|nr:asparagine synthase-related protein [Sutcliffiella rhizosphaerae]CAG9620748.1 hypothetical protein BACCIP111883_01518 [Sutcliffiella rhizosphaerae]